MRHSGMRSCASSGADQSREVAEGTAPARVYLSEGGPAAAGDGAVVDAVVDFFLEWARWNGHEGSVPHSPLVRAESAHGMIAAAPPRLAPWSFPDGPSARRRIAPDLPSAAQA